MKTAQTAQTLPSHLFVSSTDGALYDTRGPQWSHKPLRSNYRRGHPTIESVGDLKATLRNGPCAWPGGYPLHMWCSDGAPLCFDCVQRNFRSVVSSMQRRDNDGWRVVACDINYEDGSLSCVNCNERIPSAYADDED